VKHENAIDRDWRSRSEVVLSLSHPQAAFFSSVETLLQAIEREELPLEQQRNMAGRALRTLDLLADSVQSAPERLRVAGYIYRFAAASEQWTFITDEVAASFAHAAALLFQEDQSAAALLLRRALAIWQRLYGPRHELILTAQHNLATLAEELGDYNEAEALLLQVITARTQMLPSDQREIAVSLHNLAGLYARQEKREEAEALYRRAVKMAAAAWGENDPFTLTARYNLALLYMQWLAEAENWQNDALERLAEAETLLKHIYTSWQSTQGSEDLATTRLLQQLAALLAGQEKWVEAEAAFRRVLANYARLLDADNLAPAICLDQLVLCLQQQGKGTEALEEARRALALRERVLGTTHPDLAPALSTLAALSIWLNHFSEAEEYLARAQAICLQVYGEEHPALLLILNTRLSLYAKTGQQSEAVALLGQISALFARLFGPDTEEARAMRAQYTAALAELEKSQASTNGSEFLPPL
jgi:hypothetical protein